MQAAKDTFENLNSDLISTTAKIANAALAHISATMMRQLSVMLAQAQEQISAMQEAMPTGNVVHLDRRYHHAANAAQLQRRHEAGSRNTPACCAGSPEGAREPKQAICATLV